jgi:hypothetical protein
MKTLILVDYDSNTAETVCSFSDEFSELPKAVQLDVAKEVRQRLDDLVSSLEAIIARSSAGTP